MIHNRRRNFILVLIAIFTLANVPSFNSVKVASAQAAATFSATVTPTRGVVLYRKAGTTDWVGVQKVQLVSEGDSVGTGSDGSASLSTVTGISVNLTPTTSVTLLKLQGADATTPANTFGLSIDGGMVQIDTGKTKGNDVVYFQSLTTVTVARNAQFIEISNDDFSAAIIPLSNSLQITGMDGQDHKATTNDMIVASGITAPADGKITQDILKQSVISDISGNITAADLSAFKNVLSQFLARKNIYGVNFVRAVLGLSEISKSDDLVKATSDTQAALDAITASDLSFNIQSPNSQFADSYAKLAVTGAEGNVASKSKIHLSFKAFILQLVAMAKASTIPGVVTSPAGVSELCAEQYAGTKLGKCQASAALIAAAVVFLATAPESPVLKKILAVVAKAIETAKASGIGN